MNIRKEFDEKGAEVRAQLEKEFRYKLATIGQKTSYLTSLIQSTAIFLSKQQYISNGRVQ